MGCGWSWAPGTAAAAQPPAPLPEDSHLLLGISFEGVVLFLKQLGLYDHATKTSSPSYVRDDDVAWVTQVCGDTLVGYDVCSAVRKWLKARGAENSSVCEVLSTDPSFADLRCHVRRANVFWSHIQGECLKSSLRSLETSIGNLDYLQCNLPTSERTLPPGGQRFYWVDYFCLKQCINDFDPHKIVALIRQIGCTVAQLDDAMLAGSGYKLGDPPSMYLTRSFCILELYATVVGKARLFFAVNVDEDAWARQLLECPIDSAAASTRKASDKKLIDAFIAKSINGGHKQFDRTVTDAMFDNLEASSLCPEQVKFYHQGALKRISDRGH